MVHLSISAYRLNVISTSKLAVFILLMSAASEVSAAPQCEQEEGDSFSLIQSNKDWRNPDASQSAPLASAVSMAQSENGKATSQKQPRKAVAVVEADEAEQNFGARSALVQSGDKILSDLAGKSGAHWGWLIPCLIFLVATCVIIGTAIASSQDASEYKQLSPLNKTRGYVPSNKLSPQQVPGSSMMGRKSPEIFSPPPTLSPRTSMETGSIVPMPASQTAMAGSQMPMTGAQWPPPLVKSLVLPTSESRLGVDIHKLAKAATDSTVDVISMSGKALLCVTIRPGEPPFANSNKLDICLVQRSSEPKCTVITPPNDNPGAPFRILDSSRAVYGEFYTTAPGVNQVRVLGMEHLVCEGDPAQLKFSVTHRTGKPVALSRLNSEDFPGGEHLEIRVLPGVDAVLVVAVILAISIFTAYEPDS